MPSSKVIIFGEVRITLRSGNSVTKSVTWQISDTTETGIYTITGIVFDIGKSKKDPFDERSEELCGGSILLLISPLHGINVSKGTY